MIRAVVRSVLAVLLLAVLAPLAGALIPGRVTPVADLDDPRGPVVIGLVQGVIHTDLLLPLTPRTREDFAFVGIAPEAEWLAVGWGARDFYTTVGSYRDLSAGAVWRAVTGDSAVMRFVPVGPMQPPMTMTISAASFDALLGAIRDDTISSRPLAQDLLTQGDRYFEAAGRFSILNTCNQWISRILRRAGQEFGGWTPTTLSVRLSLSQN
ncbi:DUF2459 domain-containing protein [Paracoccus aerodenitrificans]|uniref:DUF2459 domain-containing protein n=1 Tax=Paracoccus aerodenitrificans TaxID=3017781 RepID=UPI0022F00871|nr:DUF2459 domain-containing protein [Paracoccus aerodenitrificans]WBU62674.1 DUF2459 domain-containing protein [Paracoccus aerodenitrificans]